MGFWLLFLWLFVGFREEKQIVLVGKLPGNCDLMTFGGAKIFNLPAPSPGLEVVILEVDLESFDP